MGKAGVLTITLTVRAGRDNYNMHIGKRALFTVLTEDCLCQLQICKQKVLINITSCLFVCVFVCDIHVIATYM